jgi:protease-4
MSELEPPTPAPEEPPRPVSPTAATTEGRYEAEPMAAVPPPPAKKSRGGMFFFGLFSGCLLLFVVVAVVGLIMAAGGGTSATEFSFSTDKVAVVPVEGEILESRDTIEALERYARSSTVRAIVVRINSPGGAIAPSQEIYSAIRQIRARTGKPVVASLDSVAASGGYYIAAACDEIVANPGSITGSIGVILQWFEMKDLVQWAKMKPETITSGPLKAAGSPFRELSDVERQYFQRIVTQLHGQFVRAVAEGRKGKMTEAEVARIADGRVVTGEEAVALKLVDRLGTIDDAIRRAGSMAGIKGEPSKIWPRRREDGLLELLADGESKAALERILSRRLPQFLYKW